MPTKEEKGYSDRAEYHRLKGRTAKADRLAAIADAYYEAAPDDDGPEAAAMAMPVPRPRMNTNAVSTTRVPKPQADEPSSNTDPVEIRVVCRPSIAGELG